MKHQITEETIECVSILAKLELSDAETVQAKEDMSRMLEYVDVLKELDTEDVEPMTHLFPVTNVFREDVVTGTDGHEAILSGAPGGQKDQMLRVPKTVE